MEDNTEYDNSITTSKSILSTKARLYTVLAFRDSAIYLSKALLFASQYTTFLASSLTSFFGLFLAY